MNKKASAILTLIFEVIAVLLVIGMVYSIATGFATSRTVNKINRAEDVKMWVNVLVSLPGDVVIENSKTFEDYYVNLYGDKVHVGIVGENKEDVVERMFILPEGYVADGFVNNVTDVCLEKKGSYINLRECSKGEIKMSFEDEEFTRGLGGSFSGGGAGGSW
jgi:uncharacterized membrane protein YgcG